MPGGDRTGPRGEGSQTGRGLGNCADSDQPGYATAQPVRGLGQGFRWGGRGRGCGRGWRNADFWPGRGRGANVVSGGTQVQDIGALKKQAEEMQNSLREFQARLTELAPEDEDRK
jgi:hypothetical protein